jgi:hypothetical protein
VIVIKAMSQPERTKTMKKLPISTDVPQDVRNELQIEHHFDKLKHEMEENYRLASSDESLRSLIDAVSDALDEVDGPSVGLSASCTVKDGAYEWAVVFAADPQMIIIDSATDYTRQSDIDIAKVICDCWDTEWND